MPLLLQVIANGGRPSLSVSARKTFQEGLRSALFRKLLGYRYRLAATDLVGKMKAEAPRDTGHLANAHGYAVDEQQLKLTVFNRVGYSAFVHEGRRPGGKMPPIEALIPWARRKIVSGRIAGEKAKAAAGVTLTPRLRKSATRDELAEARSLAFLVARKIKRFGSRPNRWFEGVLARNGLETVAAQVMRAVEDYNQVMVVGMAEEAKARLDAGLGNTGGPVT